MESQIKINQKLILDSIASKDITLKNVALELEVSVSDFKKWLDSSDLPNSMQLLKLSELLDINFKSIFSVSKEYHFNFRMANRQKLKDLHYEIAENIANSLKDLTKLYGDKTTSYKLDSPSLEGYYLLKISSEFRSKITKDGIINKTILIDYIQNVLNTEIVPVLWGSKKRFAEGLQVSFPNCSFLFYNIESKPEDELFWLLHEVAHLLTPVIDDEIKEQFADKFAQHVLYPISSANDLISRLDGLINKEQVALIRREATKHKISPYNVYKQIQDIIESQNTKFKLVPAKYLFNRNKAQQIQPKLDLYTYLEVVCKEEYKSQFFVKLKEHLKEIENGPKFIANTLHYSYPDALGIYNYIKNYES